MRAQEFLREYSRDITSRRLGEKLQAKLDKDPTSPAYTQPADEDAVEHALSAFEQIDPTPNKQYVQWIARTYASDPSFKMEDVLGQVAGYLAKFHALNIRKKLPAPRNDINRYSNFADFMSVMDEYDDPTAQALVDKGDATELYNDENIRVIVPENQEAACYYGQGTRWCTAATKGSNYFDYYSDAAPLMIVIPKRPAYLGEKYQLWFFYGMDDELITSDDDFLETYHRRGEDYVIDHEQFGQFMNELDQPLGLKKLMARFGNSLVLAINALEKKYPGMKYAVERNFEDSGIK